MVVVLAQSAERFELQGAFPAYAIVIANQRLGLQTG